MNIYIVFHFVKFKVYLNFNSINVLYFGRHVYFIMSIHNTI